MRREGIPKLIACVLGILYVLAVVVFGLPLINDRACRAGLPSCNLGFDAPTKPPQYIAARALGRNDIVAETDLVEPKSLPAGAFHLLPARKSLVGKYVETPIAPAKPIEAGNLLAQPTILPVEARCLAAAELGAYTSATLLLRPGRRVALSCLVSPGASCSAAGVWTIVAHVERVGDETGGRVLVTADPKRCEEPSLLIVVGMPDREDLSALRIQFELGKADISAGSRATIEITQLMKAQPNLQLNVEGHTDSLGTRESNKALSAARADAVAAAIASGGIDRARLFPAGFGAERPIADNRSDHGRARNRRVEFVRR